MKIEFLEDLYFQGLKEKAEIQKGLGLPIALITGAGSILFFFVNTFDLEFSLVNEKNRELLYDAKIFIIYSVMTISLCSITFIINQIMVN